MFEDRRTSDLLPSLTAALAWGAMFPIAATAIEHVDAFHLTAVRYLVATAIFLGLLAFVEGRRALLPQGRALELFVLGTLGFACFNLFAYVALEHTPPQDAALIIATAPLLTAFAVWLTTRQKPTATTFGAMAVALFGVVLVVEIGRGYRPGEFEILGALLTIAALVFANLAGRSRPVAMPALARLES
jgi:drug/metabolite transporter (DMT)-like permease